MAFLFRKFSLAEATSNLYKRSVIGRKSSFFEKKVVGEVDRSASCLLAFYGSPDDF